MEENLERRIATFQGEVGLEGKRAEGYASLASTPYFSQPLPNFSREYDALNPATEAERLMAGVILDMQRDHPQVAEIITGAYHSMRKNPATMEAFLKLARWDFYSRDYSYLEPTHFPMGSGERFAAFDDAMLGEARAEAQGYEPLVQAFTEELEQARDKVHAEALRACLDLSVYLRDNPKVLMEIMVRECGPTDEGNAQWRHFSKVVQHLKDEIAPTVGTSLQGMVMFGVLLGKFQGMAANRRTYSRHWEDWPELPVMEAIFQARHRGISPLDLLEFTIRDDVYNREWALAAL